MRGMLAMRRKLGFVLVGFIHDCCHYNYNSNKGAFIDLLTRCIGWKYLYIKEQSD